VEAEKMINGVEEEERERERERERKRMLFFLYSCKVPAVSLFFRSPKFDRSDPSIDDLALLRADARSLTSFTGK